MERLKKIALMGLGVGFGLLLLFKVGVYLVDSYDCSAKWSESGIEYKYSFRGGCKVKRGDGWIPAENYRAE
jgi:hypothetical protein